MYKVLSISAFALMTSLALAGGDSVKHAVKTNSSVYSAVPASYSSSLLCNLRQSDRINRSLNEIVDQTLSSVRTINKEDVAVSLIEICPEDGCQPAIGSVHGEEMLYASGFARLPYAAATFAAEGKVSGQLKADLMASLRDADYGATNRVIDNLRSSGGSDAANKFLYQLGFQDFNVNQRFVSGEPAGDDADSLGRKLTMNYENSNRLTSNQVAGLFYLISQDALVSPGASQTMKAFMHHPLEQRKISPLQGIAGGLPVGSEIVSINGYSVRNYHEAALVTLPNGKKYVLSVMTKYNRYPTVFIPLLSRTIAFRMMTETGSEDPALHTYIPKLAR